MDFRILPIDTVSTMCYNKDNKEKVKKKENKKNQKKDLTKETFDVILTIEKGKRGL